MTIHAAKGLEFPVVYIVGLEENLFPSQFCSKPSEIEEERRLLYVAITRAMDACHLSYAKQRFRNGQVCITSPSRFLNDIDRRYLQLMAPEADPARTNRTRWSRSSWEDDDSNFSLPYRSAHSEDEPAPVFQKNIRPITASMNEGKSDNTDYPERSRVFHRVFGEGTVLRVYRENDNDKIDIAFDTKGQKTLLLTYARLEKR